MPRKRTIENHGLQTNGSVRILVVSDRTTEFVGVFLPNPNPKTNRIALTAIVLSHLAQPLHLFRRRWLHFAQTVAAA